MSVGSRHFSHALAGLSHDYRAASELCRGSGLAQASAGNVAKLIQIIGQAVGTPEQFARLHRFAKPEEAAAERSRLIAEITRHLCTAKKTEGGRTTRRYQAIMNNPELLRRILKRQLREDKVGYIAARGLASLFAFGTHSFVTGLAATAAAAVAGPPTGGAAALPAALVAGALASGLMAPVTAGLSFRGGHAVHEHTKRAATQLVPKATRARRVGLNATAFTGGFVPPLAAAGAITRLPLAMAVSGGVVAGGAAAVAGAGAGIAAALLGPVASGAGGALAAAIHQGVSRRLHVGGLGVKEVSKDKQHHLEFDSNLFDAQVGSRLTTSHRTGADKVKRTGALIKAWRTARQFRRDFCSGKARECVAGKRRDTKVVFRKAWQSKSLKPLLKDPFVRRVFVIGTAGLAAACAGGVVDPAFAGPASVAASLGVLAPGWGCGTTAHPAKHHVSPPQPTRAHSLSGVKAAAMA